MNHASRFGFVLGLSLTLFCGNSGCGRSPELKPPPASTDIIPKLKSEDPMIRGLACASLAVVADGDPDAITALEGMLKDPDERVQKAAQDALDKLRGGE